MVQGDRPGAESDPPDADATVRDRTGCRWWVPRLPTILTALLVGYSLFVMIDLERTPGSPLVKRYGWPFIHRVAQRQGLRPGTRIDTGSLAANVVVAAALLASSCFTAQIATCLLVRSTCIKLRSVCGAIAVVAICCAVCRFRPAILLLALYGGFYFSLASPILPILMLLLRLELPAADDPEPWSYPRAR